MSNAMWTVTCFQSYVVLGFPRHQVAMECSHIRTMLQFQGIPSLYFPMAKETNPEMNRDTSASKHKNYSTPKDVIDLYTKIPDYAQVKHLGNSEFINTLERLKDEFRSIRASLYEDTTNSENETEIQTAGENNKTLNIQSLDRDHVKPTRSCALHQTPSHYGYQQKSNWVASFDHHLKSNISNPNRYYDSRIDSVFQDDDDDIGQRRVSSSTSSSSESTSMSTTISIWSSNPEIYHKIQHKEYFPPTRIETRIQWRNFKNYSTSEPQLSKEYGDSAGAQKTTSTGKFIHFKAHPVPDHVHQPLFDKIMLRNKLRSDQVREESKQKLLAQVKPFSFTANKLSTSSSQERKSSGHGGRNNKDFFSSNTNHELFLLNNASARDWGDRRGAGIVESLNNTNQLKQRNERKRKTHRCLRSKNSNRLAETAFRANPAPPRTRALMAAVRLREQQEYRELKKRLRSEALLKTSSLPPSMAARDKQQKASEAKTIAILNQLDLNSKAQNKLARIRRRPSPATSTEDAGTTLTTDDDERYSADEEFVTSMCSLKPETCNNQPNKLSTKYKANFTPFGPSKFASKQDGIFESTSNDNHASRLRAQTARKREQERIKREDEEQLRLQKMDNRRQSLRVWHLPAWKHASSYSSSQDISMRCELRMAASILEKESYRKDLDNMLSRVQSAPLLLEGLRNFSPKERKYEICKKHRQELNRNEQHFSSNKFYSPRSLEKPSWVTTSHVGFLLDDGHEKSETAAIAEGSSGSNAGTNSDNESVKNIIFDSVVENETQCECTRHQESEDDKEEVLESKTGFLETQDEDKKWNNLVQMLDDAVSSNEEDQDGLDKSIDQNSPTSGQIEQTAETESLILTRSEDEHEIKVANLCPAEKEDASYENVQKDEPSASEFEEPSMDDMFKVQAENFSESASRLSEPEHEVRISHSESFRESDISQREPEEISEVAVAEIDDDTFFAFE